MRLTLAALAPILGRARTSLVYRVPARLGPGPGPPDEIDISASAIESELEILQVLVPRSASGSMQLGLLHEALISASTWGTVALEAVGGTGNLHFQNAFLRGIDTCSATQVADVLSRMTHPPGGKHALQGSSTSFFSVCLFLGSLSSAALAACTLQSRSSCYCKYPVHPPGEP
ncbi:hypothetical protein ACSS6W_006723 [Trichoderma asperelloides]